ncbi:MULTISPECIES: hypothetical protein [Peribacillus]|uniref:Uncharacterized protein n=1 Tax=Peribacillus castrilensis TaxID=2897690 RepID=A0AAW9N557_9BACI|nr:hypothetical protein [Peribacillus frigoritolerans]MEC0273588.1 hypothetical protein [Peribacillus castrilensis]TFH61161.1 hypothetical protein E4J71_12615 [Peribacillus frigoritolerans]
MFLELIFNRITRHVAQMLLAIHTRDGPLYLLLSTLIARPKRKVTINMFIVFMVMFAKEPSFVRGRIGKAGMIPLLNRQLLIAGVL